MKLFPKINLSPLTLKIFFMEFIDDFILIYPLYAIMFSDRSQVSAAGVGILLATWQIVSVIAEVPTGIIADLLSKKWAIFLGKGLRLIGFGCWLFIPNFYGYLLGFILWGIGEAFNSGTLQAYLYETLSPENKKDFSKIYSRTQSLSMLSFTLAFILSFFIGPQYNLLLVASMLASLISIIICITLPDIKIDKKCHPELHPNVLKLALSTIKNSTNLRRIFITTILIQCLSIVLIEYIPVYYQQVGTPTNLVPLLLALGNAIGVFLFWIMHRFEKHLINYQLIIVSIATLIFILGFNQNTFIAVAVILLFTRLIRLMNVSSESAVQHLALDEARATIGSIYSFLARGLAALIILAIGFLAISDSVVWSVRYLILTTIGLYILIQLFFTFKKPHQI